MKSAREIEIRLDCHHLPGSCWEGRTTVRLGVQRGREVVDDVAGDAANATFTVPLRVERDAETGKPNFLGPYAQGTRDQRFIYLSWGERNGDEWEMFRRAKIHLSHLGWETVEAALAGAPIEASVYMTGRDGSPLCASVKAGSIVWNLS